MWSKPSTLADIIGNDNICDILSSFLESSEGLPNLLFVGSDGCGKSTIAEIIVKKYLGKYHRYYNLTIDGSIDRCKNIVTETHKKTDNTPINIINFIKKSYLIPKNILKIVTIHDFDCMRKEAQMALRRIIEIYSHKVRFIFICNSLNDIVEAIQSRTLILKFKPISSDVIKEILKKVSLEENVELSETIYENIIALSGSNIKQALNYFRLFLGSTNKTLEIFEELFGIPNISLIQQILNESIDRNYKFVFNELKKLFNNGYTNTDILNLIINILIYSTEIENKYKVIFFKEITKCIRQMNSNSNVYLYNMFIQIHDEFS